MRIVEHAPALAADFKRLNVEWIEHWFAIEPADLVVLDDPDGHVLAHGGRIFYAVDDDDVAVGCVALKHEGDGVYELSKMAVSPERRGGGIGRLLMDAVLGAFRQSGGTTLYLESNRRLTSALALYERSGFVERQPPHPSPFSRADVYMVWEGGER
ncbi:MAG TPA: GNAT family N-acetyltransferase [Acidimicrobiales bacterium]|nr:GNAT family N-acetyltransferase [Acidimicrobiales bacterium]